jgi:hypothetical protein
LKISPTNTKIFNVNPSEVLLRKIFIGMHAHNNLRRHLHLMGLSESPLCRRCGAEDENSAHILCECEALVSLRHVYVGSYFLEPEDVKSISLGPSGTSAK